MRIKPVAALPSLVENELERAIPYHSDSEDNQ
jgi:hypothetical protein